MSGTWAFLRRLGRRVWFRAALFSIGAVVFALAAGLVGAFVPFEVIVDLGQNSVGTLLQILATSMLTVTTFSLTAMVTAYSAATTTATPRATQLMVEDTTSQNALSTFVGAFVYAMVGIIALSTGYYGEQGRTILFFGTLVVVATVVVTLLRWIAHLVAFGRVADVIDRVERAATASLVAHGRRPHLGGRPPVSKPAGAATVHAVSPGYVATVDVARLQPIAEGHELTVHVLATPGRTVDVAHPLAAVVGDGATALDGIRSAFRVSSHRDYEQDPRLGVIALTEIGSRALSAATNDPGTAIDVIGALQRTFTALLCTTADPGIPYDRVVVPAVAFADLLEDAFRPLSRDGAGTVEVAIRMQKCLGALAATAPQHGGLIHRVADAAADRADAALDRPDRRRLRAVRRAVWP